MAAIGDEPMSDAPAPTPAATATATAATTKPRRRFVPQLVEETVKKSSNNITTKRESPPPSSSSSAEAAIEREKTTKTKDASVQVDDIEMKDSPTSQPRRRFVPVPIETTFDSYRVSKNNPHGPTAELTPEPSPMSPHLPVSLIQIELKVEEKKAKPRRKFAPQLIETSRRSRREGQQGPATKPTDKTDITPGTNHIYAPKQKRRPVPAPRDAAASGLRDSDDENVARHLTPRRQQSMKPHPNTRRGTKQNSFHLGLDTIVSSESDNSSDDDEEEAKPSPFTIGAPAVPQLDDEPWTATNNYGPKHRRESCDEEFSGYLLAVAAREAYKQRELEQAMSAFPNGVRPEGVEHFFVRDNSEDDNAFDIEKPRRHGTSKLMIRRKSTDPGWAVREMRQHAEKLGMQRPDSRTSLDDELDQMEITTPPEDPLWTTAGPRPDSRDENRMSPFIAASSPLHVGSPHIAAAVKPLTPSPAIHPEVPGFRTGPFGNPFAGVRDENEDRELRRMRKAASPPMLGADLKFRMCPSPKVTKMEPDHPYSSYVDTFRPREPTRDATGQKGLWRGYCVAETNEKTMSTALHGPALLATPCEPPSPSDPFAVAFSANMGMSGAVSPRLPPSPRNSQHIFAGVEERLQKEQARKERILAEFDDAFITQVYNYISLGYPATARAYDEELSKISGISMYELRQDDNKKFGKGFMLDMEIKLNGSDCTSDGFSFPEEDERRSRDKPPRWQALRLYIREWARQHPDLADDGNPLAWGVRARRGSWAV